MSKKTIKLKTVIGDIVIVVSDFFNAFFPPVAVNSSADSAKVSSIHNTDIDSITSVNHYPVLHHPPMEIDEEDGSNLNLEQETVVTLLEYEKFLMTTCNVEDAPPASWYTQFIHPTFIERLFEHEAYDTTTQVAFGIRPMVINLAKELAEKSKFIEALQASSPTKNGDYEAVVGCHNLLFHLLGDLSLIPTSEQEKPNLRKITVVETDDSQMEGKVVVTLKRYETIDGVDVFQPGAFFHNEEAVICDVNPSNGKKKIAMRYSFFNLTPVMGVINVAVKK